MVGHDECDAAGGGAGFSEGHLCCVRSFCFVFVNGSSVAAPRPGQWKIKQNTGGRSQCPAPVHRHARGQSSPPLARGHLVRTQKDTGEKKNTHRVLHEIKIYRVLGITE